MDWGQHRAGQLSKLMEPSDTGNFNTISRSSINSRVAATTASTVKNCKFDNTLRTRHAAPAATRSTERDAAATAVRRDAGERAASTGERAPPVTSRMEPAGGCMAAAGQQDHGRRDKVFFCAEAAASDVGKVEAARKIRLHLAELIRRYHSKVVPGLARGSVAATPWVR